MFLSFLSSWYDSSSQIFFYRPIFMAELIIAEVLFTTTLRRKPYFWLRLVFSIAALLRFSFFVPVIDYNAFYNAFMFFLMFAATVLFMKFLFDESWKTIIFCALSGYTVQHVSFELYNLIAILFSLSPPANIYVSAGPPAIFSNAKSFTAFLGAHFFTYFFMHIFFARKLSKHQPLELKNLSLLMIIFIVTLSNIALSSIVTYTCYSPYNVNAIVMLSLYNVFCSILCIYVEFKTVLARNLENDLVAEKRLRRLENEQYALSKENVRLINLKCHDLKHQIRTIGKKSVVDGEVLKEIEEAVNIYDGALKTGNDALDIIIAEKSLFCAGKNVRLSCTVNCIPLKFMKDSDVYALFGNAIDNAVRAAARLKEEKRVISISIKRRDSMVSIDIRNYYDGDLKFSEGLPRSTKANDGYHGFGLQSMREIVSRYGGEFVVTAENGIFTVDMLFFDAK